jgi:hypothetical protein
VGLDGSTFDATTGFDAGFPPSWDAAVPDAFVPWFDAGGSNTGTDASGPPLPWDASIPFDTDAGLPDGAPATDASVDAGLTFDAAIFDAAILDANLSDAMVLPPGLDASPPSDASLVTDAAPPNDGAGNDNADAASSSDGASGMSDGSSTTPDATGPVNPTPDASGPPGSDASGGNGPVAPFDPTADLPPGAALDGSTDGSGSTSRPTPDPIRTDPNGTIPSTSSSGAAPRSKSGCTAAPASLGDANGSTLVVMSLLLPLLRRGRRREP